MKMIRSIRQQQQQHEKHNLFQKSSTMIIILQENRTYNLTEIVSRQKDEDDIYLLSLSIGKVVITIY